MALTDIIRKTSFALTAGLTLASPAYSEQPKPFPDAIPQYSQEQLRPPILPKEMSETERKDTQSYYKLLKPEEKIAFKEIFSNPRDYMKRTFKTKEEQKDFEDYFNIELMGIPKKERKYMEGILDDGLKRFPWKSDSKTVYNPKVNDDYTLSRRLWQYHEDKKFEKIIIDMPKRK